MATGTFLGLGYWWPATSFIRAQFRVLPRVQQLRVVGGASMQAIPLGVGLPPSISPLDSNQVYTIDASGITTGAPLTALTATATTSTDPQGTTATQDVTATFVRNASWLGNTISLTLGNGAQLLGQIYVVQLLVTLGNAQNTVYQITLLVPCSN